MKARREYLDYLEDIQDAIEKIEGFTRGLDFEGLKQDERTIFAVVRAFEIMGEAAKKVPRELRNRYPSVPWKRMAGMRDKIIHEYFAVDLDVVWKAVQEDVPALKPLLRQVVAEEKKREASDHA